MRQLSQIANACLNQQIGQNWLDMETHREQIRPPFSPTMDRLFNPEKSTPTEQAMIRRLQNDYSEPHRHFHTLDQHVTRMMAFLDTHYAGLGQTIPETVVAATLNIDRVFQPGLTREKNARLSAQKAAADLKDMAEKTPIPDINIEKVEKYIRATADHVVDPDDPDMQAFIDADLSVLGASTAEYGQYAEFVRQEYEFAFIQDEDFATVRSGYLYELLGRERLFSTDAAQEALGQWAGGHMTAELCRLQRSVDIFSVHPQSA